MPTEIEATSPATSGDAKGSGGLTSEQAAARLFASAAKAATQKPTELAAEKPPQSEPTAQSPEVTAAEAQTASAEPASPETTQAEGATDETAATETEGGEGDANDDVLSPATLDEKLKAKIQKRIDKEVGKRKQLETKLAELEAKLTQQAPPAATNAAPATPQPDVPLAVPNQPLAKVHDLPSLKQQEQMAKDALRWAEDTLDNPRAWKVKTDVDPETGAEVTTKITTIGKEVYDEQAIRAVRRDAKIMLEDHIPQRKEFLIARQSAQKTAHDAYPFLHDKTSPDYQLAQQMLRDPWVNMRPDAEWIVGTQIKGIRALEGERTAAAKKAEPAKPKAAPAKPSNDQSAVSSSGSPSRVSADTAQRLARTADRKGLEAKGGITAAEAAAFLQRNTNSRKSG